MPRYGDNSGFGSAEQQPHGPSAGSYVGGAAATAGGAQLVRRAVVPGVNRQLVRNAQRSVDAEAKRVASVAAANVKPNSRNASKVAEATRAKQMANAREALYVSRVPRLRSFGHRAKVGGVGVLAAGGGLAWLANNVRREQS